MKESLIKRNKLIIVKDAQDNQNNLVAGEQTSAQSLDGNYQKFFTDFDKTIVKIANNKEKFYKEY